MQHRAALLFGAVAALALLSGCSAVGSIDMRTANETELANRASHSLDELATAHVEGERPPQEVARAAIANGSTTVTAISAPLTGELPFEFEGAYYNLTSTVVDTRTANAVSISIDYNTTGANGTAIQFADLPPADQEALDSLFPQRAPPRREGTNFGVGAIYNDTELNASVLTPTQEYDAVIYEGERYALSVDEPRSVTVETYRYESTQIAPNTSAYAAHSRETYAFTLSGLSGAERNVIESAIGGDGYHPDSTDDAAFEAVLERFRSHDAIVGDQGSGTWLVRYNGTLYLADLRYGAFLED